MANEVIFVCKSLNNKNVREGELEVLEMNEEGLYFEFGENQMNKKKRFYADYKTMKKDFDALQKIKESLGTEKKSENEVEVDEPENFIEDVEDVKDVEDVEYVEDKNDKTDKIVKTNDNISKKHLRR